MKRILGYISAGVGFFILALNSTVSRNAWSFLENIGNMLLLIPGLIFIILGIVILIITGDSGGKGKVKHVTEEVPIYQGEGKKRRIVGYKVE